MGHEEVHSIESSQHGNSGTSTFNNDVFFKSGKPWFDVRGFGAVGNGSTDDSTSINNAITALPSTGGTIFFPPLNYKINSTILATKDCTYLTGPGAKLTWGGSGGSPMVRFQNTFMGGISNMRLIGNTGAQPSSAISINATSGGGPSGLAVQGVQIGTIGATNEFVNGISWDGSNVNSDRNWFSDVLIYGCTGHGIDLAITQAVSNTFEAVHVKNTAIAWYLLTNATIRGTQVLNSSTVDFYVDQNSSVTVENFHSEGSARFIQQRNSAMLDIRNGIWHAGVNTDAGGIIVDCVDNTRTKTALKSVSFYADTSYSGPTPKLSVHANPSGATKKSLRLENVRGWTNGNGNAVSFTPAGSLDLVPATSGDLILAYIDVTDISAPNMYAYAQSIKGSGTTTLYGSTSAL